MTHQESQTIQLFTDPEEQIRTAKAQGESILEIASKIENNEPLTSLENGFIVAVLKGIAVNHYFKYMPPRPVGHQPQIDHAGICVRYYLQVRSGVKSNSAYEKTAEDFECEVTTVKKHIAKDKTNGSLIKKMCDTGTLVSHSKINP